MPHVVIDARRIRDFGIGTYIRNLIHALSRLEHKNRYTLIIPSSDIPEIQGLGSNFTSCDLFPPGYGSHA